MSDQRLFTNRWQRTRISKLIAYILRHDPGKFGISLDRYGFADLEELLRALKLVHPWVERAHIEEIVSSSTKRRFQVKGDKIRATYGHSVEVEPLAEVIEPPELLYHGTSPATLEEIKREGLKPMQRQWVHLSVSEADALEVGRRKAESPIILKIKARLAYQSGIEFRREGDIYLVKSIPPEFIDFPKIDRPQT